MSASFVIGDRLRVRALPEMSKRPPFRVGDLVTVERVSPLGSVIVTSHGGYFRPIWFELEPSL